MSLLTPKLHFLSSGTHLQKPSGRERTTMEEEVPEIGMGKEAPVERMAALSSPELHLDKGACSEKPVSQALRGRVLYK